MREHGTRACYVFGVEGQDWRNGCRCFDCSQAAVLYEKRRQRARLRGEPAFIDATEARKHLDFLRTQHVGRRTVAHVTGLSQSAIWNIATGRTTRIRPSTADKILGVHAGKAKPGQIIDGTRTLQQVDDLIRLCGMKKVEIARIVHDNPKALALQLAPNGRVRRSHADRVDALWQERMAPILAQRDWQATERAKYRAKAREQAS